MSFLEWLNKEAPYWLLRGLQRIGLPQRGEYALILALVCIYLCGSIEREKSTRQGKRKLILWRLYISLLRLGIARKKENLQCPFCVLLLW